MNQLDNNTPSFQPLWANELAGDARDINWLWHGFLAPGLTTLLTSQSKSGKTTLAKPPSSPPCCTASYAL